MKELSIKYNKKRYEDIRVPNELTSDFTIHDAIAFAVYNFFNYQNCPVTIDDIKLIIVKSNWTDSDIHYVVNNNYLIEVKKDEKYTYINVVLIESTCFDVD